MGKSKVETKTLTINIQNKREAQKLAELRADGWEIVSEHKRGALQFKPGQIDYVLSRAK